MLGVWKEIFGSIVGRHYSFQLVLPSSTAGVHVGRFFEIITKCHEKRIGKTPDDGSKQLAKLDIIAPSIVMASIDVVNLDKDNF